MRKRNTEDKGSRRRGTLGKTMHLLARGGIGTARLALIIAGWLLATATTIVFLWLTINLEEGLSLPGIAFVYVLRTILGSLLLALVILPVACVLPRRWREKLRTFSRRHVVIAIMMTMAIMSVFVALWAVKALG